ncbi:substrate-binding periplasmic protein [Agaribacterium haliotis]|uniref:substrate-binding periplasmic protein n=1 Tax=Agaribacterium haliotis TaxID=2013869 RepID=UPI00195D9E26|nr:transporter substrate-binding domain-containing protein [Agaribacterium haliotis]
MIGNSRDHSLPAVVLRQVAQRLNMDYEHPYEDIERVSSARARSDLSSGDLDVIWDMSSLDMEQQFDAIHFPLYRGILGMRLALVRKDRSKIFAGVKNLRDLQQFQPGQGRTWADTAILEANGLSVVKTGKYQNLFPMLEGGRFDYFPRGLYEPWNEIRDHAELELSVEPNILIRYRAPLYFFVKKGNTRLHTMILSELEAMLLDGSYNELFFSDPAVKMGMENAHLRSRTIIDLDNPFLSPKTPLERKELWFDPLRDY